MITALTANCNITLGLSLVVLLSSVDRASIYHRTKPEKDTLSERFQEKEVIDELHRWFTIHKSPPVEPSVSLCVWLGSLDFKLGLSDEELLAVNQAVRDADIKEWVKLAIMQRANAINKLRESLDEDWASIPSDVLMNDKRYRTNSGACRELVSCAIRVVKQ